MKGPVLVSAIDTAHVRMRAHPDLVVQGAKGAHDQSDFLLVRVTASNGLTGYGEVSATPLWSGEDGTTADHLIQTVLAPALIGKPLAPVGATESTMDRLLAGNPFTKAGVGTALWDVYARLLDVPLAQALGGPYRTEIPIKLSLSGDDAHLTKVYESASAAGFRAFKVKVGLGVEGDVARMALARKLVGERGFLGVDANGGWSRAQARRAIRLLAPYGPAFIEQPTQPGDLEGMAELRSEGFPVIADESVFGMDDLVRVIRAKAADVISVYIGKSGGPGRAVQLGRTAAAFGLGSLLGSNGELGVGAAAQLQVACALPELTTEFPSDIIGAHYYAEDILAEPLDSDGAFIRLPDAAGLGVRLADEVLALFDRKEQR
ncbi:dipeptide epimerase [Fodinicola feengrottensis]|uniref:Dipeptide epimerase n=1 Tax=Fodinicola feengrottensis TaxID=435914 RepID=A0ABN2INZ4_9ACTN